MYAMESRRKSIWLGYQLRFRLH